MCSTVCLLVYVCVYAYIVTFCGGKKTPLLYRRKYVDLSACARANPTQSRSRPHLGVASGNATSSVRLIRIAIAQMQYMIPVCACFSKFEAVLLNLLLA